MGVAATLLAQADFPPAAGVRVAGRERERGRARGSRILIAEREREREREKEGEVGMDAGASAAQMEKHSSAAAFVEGGVQDACDDACSICLEAFSDSDPSAVRAALLPCC